MKGRPPSVSVIVPVYNVEPYLRQCMVSILEQTLDDIEIICVDDGSTDGCPAILAEYAAADHRVTVVMQENCGCGAARNAGMAIARGEYVIFLDSDDVFELDMLQKAHSRAEETGCDIVVFGLDCFTDGIPERGGGTGSPAYVSALDGRVFKASDLAENALRADFLWMFAWNKLYRRSFLEDAKISFYNPRFMEDVPFVTVAFLLAESVSYIDEALVHYRQRQGSLTKSRNAVWRGIYDALASLRADLCERGLYEENERLFLNQTLFHLRSLYDNTSGEQHVALHDTLHYEWLEDFGLSQRPRDYYIRRTDYEWMRRILDDDAEGYARRRLVFYRERVRSLEEELARIEKEIARVENGFSYRLGRLLRSLRRRVS